jgi:hypothetical protein
MRVFIGMVKGALVAVVAASKTIPGLLGVFCLEETNAFRLRRASVDSCIALGRYLFRAHNCFCDGLRRAEASCKIRSPVRALLSKSRPLDSSEAIQRG